MNPVTVRQVGFQQQTLQKFMSRVYLWMVFGFLLSGLMSYQVIHSPYLLKAILGNSLVFNGLLIAQLVSVFAFAFLSRKNNFALNAFLFIVYSLLTGTTLSFIFMIYTQESINNIFFITAGSFLGLSLVGYTIKKDLSFIGTFCYMGLIGMIIVGLLAFFVPGLRSDTMQLTIAAIGVIVFTGLTAYDTQKIKQAYLSGTMQNENAAAIGFALTLYLDFINLFLSLLRLFGGRR